MKKKYKVPRDDACISFSRAQRDVLMVVGRYVLRSVRNWNSSWSSGAWIPDIQLYKAFIIRLVSLRVLWRAPINSSYTDARKFLTKGCTTRCGHFDQKYFFGAGHFRPKIRN